MKHFLIAALLCVFASASPSPAAPGDANPTMTPAGKEEARESNNPFGMAVLGKERPKDAKTEITAKKQASFDNATNIAEFEGTVVVKDPQFTLFCDRLKVTMSKNRKGMQLCEAFGNVIIVQENTDPAGKTTKSIGRAGQSVYEPVSGDITLKFSPSVQSDVNLQVGEPDTVMILNRTGKSRTIGSSKTVIVNTGDKSQTP